MPLFTRRLGFAFLVTIATVAQAQIARPTFPAPPTTEAAVGDFAAAIAQRAAELVTTPAQWNHNERGACPAVAKTFSLICAMERAKEEAAGIFRDESGHRAGVKQTTALPADCRFHAAPEGREGSCGVLFDELPIFTISRVKAITSGTWRTDMQPLEVWSGTMADAESPVETEAREVINVVTTKKYSARLAGVTSTESTLNFQIDTSKQVPPSALDIEILKRADKIISSGAVWNRADNRECPPTATTWSIYCAVEVAEVQVAGGFHHRRPVMELVRTIVDERTAKKTYPHRLMGYNNDPTTKLEDVRTLFAEAISRISK
jgi:hypothetical protein